MIKGSQKQMIVVRTGDSRYFDEAYFVLRREIKAGSGSRGDILSEANRILQESVPDRAPRRRLRAAICFCGGVLSGGGVCALLFLLL